MRSITIAATLCLATAVSGSARADESTEQAARLFKSATDLYARHEFREAARQFESAYRSAPRGAAIYDAGLAWEQAGEPARAADDFAAAIGNGDTSSQQRSDASAHLKALEARLARLVVTGPADAHVAVDDGSASSLPLGVHLVPGTHGLFVTYAGGRTESRDVDAQAGAEVVIRLTAPASTQSTDASASSGPAPETPPASGDGGASLRRTLAWSSLAGAGLVSILAVYFYVQGENALSQYEDDPAHPGNLKSQALTDRTVTQLLAGLTVALGASSAFFFLWSPSPSPTAPSTSLRVGPTGASLRVSF